MNRLQTAMANASALDIGELEAAADAIGMEAVQIALAQADAGKAEAAAQRQRDLDAALADVVEIVARHRARLGRRVCSRSDGAVVRQMFDLLRCMGEIGADADPSFQ